MSYDEPVDGTKSSKFKYKKWNTFLLEGAIDVFKNAQDCALDGK